MQAPFSLPAMMESRFGARRFLWQPTNLPAKGDGASQTPGAPAPALSLGQEIPRRLRQGLQAGEELNSMGRARGTQRDLGEK